MLIKKKENHVFISSEEKEMSTFLSAFKKNQSDLEKNNLIIDLSGNLDDNKDAFSALLEYAKQYKKNGTSFVIIKENVDVDKFPEWFNIVPTLTEAEDILEMEEIERDLGF